MAEKYYITTPIYYPSAKLHIGHAYCTTATDTIARYKRLMGYDVMFLTGSDEHGQKIEKLADAKGVTPQQYVDEIVASIQDLWKKLNISNDDFIRTTQDRHIKACQYIFRKLYEQGDIYKSHYEGWYCTPCESFWTETQLVDGKCPDCGREVQKTQEEAYFFRASKYAPALIKYIGDHPDFIQPESRKNEMLKNFLLPGLEDLCVSRTSFKWGIPVTFDPDHIMYVWVDALSNYITALGYSAEDDSRFAKYWPADLHVVGKEIVRFHTIVWPCMLMALGLPLPKQVFGHGWLVVNGDKMSKSKGNVVDPVFLIDRYGADAIRYFLMREVPFGSDGCFSNEALINRINADLANDLGNLLSRTVAMIDKYFGGEIKENSCPKGEEDDSLVSLASGLRQKVEGYVDNLHISDALTDIWKYIGALNKYIDVTMPWALAKDESGIPRLQTVLYNLAEGLRIIATLISPVMPETAEKMAAQLGLSDGDMTWEKAGIYGSLRVGTKVTKGEALFPRIDAAKELEYLSQTQSAPQTKKEETKEQITIDDFAKIDLRTAKVISAENLEGSDKLLKLQVKCGDETRTIVSGIRQSYTAEDMVGKTVVIVANLRPAKLRGVMSEGMILATGDKSEIVLVSPEKETQDGKSVH